MHIRFDDQESENYQIFLNQIFLNENYQNKVAAPNLCFYLNTLDLSGVVI